MLMQTQPNPDRDLLAEIERLEPLAKAEQLAGGRENPWTGKTEELKAARARLEAARVAREAEAQAREVREYQNELDRREGLLPKLAEVDAKLAALGETTRDYFAQANDIMRWSGFDRVWNVRMDKYIIEPRSPYKRRDPWGNVIDEPPIGRDQRPVVPADEWEAVKQYRELYFQRLAVGGELDAINRNVSEMAARTPALAFVKPRETVPA